MDTLCGRNRRILSGLAEREQNKGVLKPTPDFKGTTHARIVFSLRQSEQYAAILSTKCVHIVLPFSSFGEPPECFFWPTSLGIVVRRSVGTMPGILGLSWLRFRPESGSNSKISGRVLNNYRGPFLAQSQRGFRITTEHPGPIGQMGRRNKTVGWFPEG